MQKYTQSKCHRFAASVLLLGATAFVPVRIASAADSTAAGPVTAQWDFDQGDLRATVGTDLQYGDGPNGRVKDHTSFGTTTSFGIPDIGGQPAKILKYTRDEFDGITDDRNPRGYLAAHGMPPNGGGTNVNQFTMIIDLMIPDLHQGDGYNTVVKWEAVDDFTVDGSISIKANDIGGDNTGGIGISGQYTGDGITWIKGGAWQRLVVAVDMAADTPIITYYLDGVKFGEMTSGDRWGFDMRHAIPPVVRLFADGENDDEVNTFYINSVQFREGTMNADQALALGGATANGIRIPSPVSYAGRVTGHWKFQQGDLRATVGTDMQYGDGPTGRMKDHTSFGTTTSFGIPDIGGQPANVMKYTRDDFDGITDDKNPRGYLTQHGVAPNGGGTNANQFTMIVDLMIPDLHQGDGYNTVVKWEAVDDFTVDGSISIKANDIGGDNTGGIGISGQYTGDGVTWITGGAWQRLVVAVDMSGPLQSITYYLDGVRFGQMTEGDRWGFDLRHAIPPTIRMFGDGENDNEVNTYYVSCIQFREGTMTADQALALGAATADGIRIPSPVSPGADKVTAQWDFDQGDLRATVGTDLQYGDGPGGRMQDHTSFGTTTSFGIPDIGGQPAKVLKYTRDEFDGITDDKNPRGYLAQHGMAPNGGGTKVNQFTMIVDLMIPDLHLGDGYNTVVKWEAVDDFTVDGSISIKANDIGGDNTGGIGISGQYTGDGVTWIKGGAWQRLVVAVDMSGPLQSLTYYLDGVKFGQMTHGDRWGFDKRHAIPPAVRLFGDGENDNEVNTYYVNSVQFREGTMTPAQALALGSATAAGIPSPTATSDPSLVINRTGTTATISWAASFTGYALEFTDSLSAPNWQPVTGVANNSITLSAGTGTRFYRLKK